MTVADKTDRVCGAANQGPEDGPSSPCAALTILPSTLIHRGGPPPRNERELRRNFNRYTSTSYGSVAMSARDRIQGSLCKTRSPRLIEVYTVAGTVAMGRTW